MKNNLTEGLRMGDLKDLVLPMFSVDEYESKITDNAIVVSFFVKDSDPAGDLNRFIGKSEIDFLDTDVSPVPDEAGHYLVFVEFIREEKFFESLDVLLESLRGITDIKKWKFKAYKSDIREYSKEAIVKKVRMHSEAKETSESQLKEFLDEARQVELVDAKLRIGSYDMPILAFGSDNILKLFDLKDKPTRMDESSGSLQRHLSAALGYEWIVSVFESCVLLEHTVNPNMLLLTRVK